MERRIALANRDCSRLNVVSLRPSLCPWTRPQAGPASSIRARRRGMNAGSFWPSPSIVTRRPARARAAALLIAADLPQDAWWRRCRSHG